MLVCIMIHIVISSNIYTACFSFYCVYVCVCSICVWTQVVCICVCMYLSVWWPEVDVGMSFSIIPSLLFERQITWSLPLGFSLVVGQLALGSSHFCLLLSSLDGVLERCITIFLNVCTGDLDLGFRASKASTLPTEPCSQDWRLFYVGML